MAAAACCMNAWAQQGAVNALCSTDAGWCEAAAAEFTRATGIKVNRVDADDAGILARLKAEGSASPADVILLVDAARLWKGGRRFEPPAVAGGP